MLHFKKNSTGCQKKNVPITLDSPDISLNLQFLIQPLVMCCQAAQAVTRIVHPTSYLEPVQRAGGRGSWLQTANHTHLVFECQREEVKQRFKGIYINSIVKAKVIILQFLKRKCCGRVIRTRSFGPVNVRIITLLASPKIQKQGLTTVQKIIPFHSQCVKMAENMDLLMSQFLPFWPPQKFKSKDFTTVQKIIPILANVSKWLKTWTC